MEPEAFINLLLDHIESKAVISTEYNYLYLHTWEVAPEIAARLPRFARFLKMRFIS
jgi:hypothetical protein